MKIGLYEDWMKPQVSKLFSKQYHITEDEFSLLIDNFYDHAFQQQKCIRIVALEGEKVIGFQSFFYWPYEINGKTFNSFQSGNSLVHEDYRGKGIFQKLLQYIDEHRESLKIDFLIGFPIDASVGSLVRNKWTNLFNLKWYIKVMNPISLFFPTNKKKLQHYFPKSTSIISNNEHLIKLKHSPEFNTWRDTHYDKSNYYSFTFQLNENSIILHLKLNLRKRIIKELIIGDIQTTTYETSFLDLAFSEFIKTIKKVNAITIISIAFNEECNYKLNDILLKHKFKKIDKKIYFCIKSFIQNETITQPGNWIVYRGDIDTW